MSLPGWSSGTGTAGARAPEFPENPFPAGQSALRQAYANATRAYEEVRFGDAYLAFTQLRDRCPRNPDVHYALGLSASAAGRLQEAVASFERVLALQEGNHQARFQLARAYLALGQYELAQTYFEELLQRNIAPQQGSDIQALLDQIDQARQSGEPHPVQSPATLSTSAAAGTEPDDATEDPAQDYIAFWAAVRRGDVTEVASYFEAGLAQETRDADGWTALHRAAEQGRLDLVRYLVSLGLPVDQPTANGELPLAVAAAHGHLDVVDFLLPLLRDQAGGGWSGNAKGTPPERRLAFVNAESIRSLATRAVQQQRPDIDLTQFTPGFVLFAKHPTEPAADTILVEWFSREPPAPGPGSTPSPDRLEVQKLLVQLDADGRFQDLEESTIQLTQPTARLLGLNATESYTSLRPTAEPPTSARRIIDTFELLPLETDLTMHKYLLLDRAEVRQDLGLQPEQTAALQQAFLTPLQAIDGVQQVLEDEQTGLDQSGLLKRQKAAIQQETDNALRRVISRFHEARLEQILSPTQSRRLAELLVQMRGPLLLAVHQPAADRLDLSPAEQAAIRNAAQQFVDRIGPPMTEFGMAVLRSKRSPPTGRAPTTSLDRLIHRAARWIRERDGAILALLSPEQRNRFQELQGRPLAIAWDPYAITETPFPDPTP